MKISHIKKYMRHAKHIADENKSCYSRRIGSILVDPISEKIISTGYNGGPRGTPHADQYEYLKEVVWPQLTQEEKKIALKNLTNDQDDCEKFCSSNHDKKICPRKLIEAKSGERLNLCPCAHSESNTIVNANGNTYGSWMFAWCGVPCIECTKLIINAHIKKVYCINWGNDYSYGSRWLFEKAGVEIIHEKPEWYLKD